MNRRVMWAALSAVVVLVPTGADAQECGYVCPQIENYCSSTLCYDGSVVMSCSEWQGQECSLPPPGQGQIRYPGDGIPWDGPVGAFAGDCFGNCGAGCSDTNNPCGGPTQYWELTYLVQPSYETMTGGFCVGYDEYRAVYKGYRALGRWTYHGWSAPGCITHDGVCPEWTWFGCLLFFGCGQPRWERQWSYDVQLVHITETLSHEIVGHNRGCETGRWWVDP